MEDYHVLGLSDELTREVRQTLRAPEYGHPVLRELAGGTGPCRACLEQFNVGHEERLLFTYRPAGGDGHLERPGPYSSTPRFVANTAAQVSHRAFGRSRY